MTKKKIKRQEESKRSQRKIDNESENKTERKILRS